MPGTDLALDPITHDLVDDDEGGWEETPTIEPQLNHQLLDFFGLWWADQNAGCKAYTIPRKANRATFRRYEDAYRDALRPFVEAGLADDLAFEVTTSQRNRLAWLASLVDTQHGEIDISPLLPYGIEV
jgi:hypothetical protein